MKKIRTLIVDDEELARKNMEVLLADYCTNVDVVGMAANAREARNFVRDNNIDLMLLDIEMPNGSGFDLLESIKDEVNFSIIFVTAYHEYALRAFKFSAVDYLLKPVNPDELTAAIAKVKTGVNVQRENIEALIENVGHGKNAIAGKIALPSMEGLQFVNLDDIIYCESQDNYTQFFLLDGRRIMVSRTIKHFEEALDESQFFRIHRSNIINLKYIDKYVKGEGGYVVMKQGPRIPVSRRRKDSFLQLFNYQQ